MELLFGIAVYRHRVQCAVEGRARPVGGPVGVGLGFGFGCTGSFPRHNARFPWIALRLERGNAFYAWKLSDCISGEFCWLAFFYRWSWLMGFVFLLIVAFAV